MIRTSSPIDTIYRCAKNDYNFLLFLNSDESNVFIFKNLSHNA